MSELNTPIRNGFLEDSLDGNNKEVINLLRLVIGGSSGSSALHLSPGATPTGAANGIRIGTDIQIYRSDVDTLKIAGAGAPILDMTSGFVRNLADPVNAQDAATKAWTSANYATGAHVHNASIAFSTGTVIHERGGLEADVSAYNGVPFISGGVTIQVKYKLDGDTAPGVSDDSSAGYGIGSRWTDTVAKEEYVCLDASVGAAVWTRTTSVGGGGAAQLSDLSDVTTAPSTANFFLATPNGSTGSYSGRALVAADIPSLAASKITSGTFVHERGGLEADVSAYSGIPYITGGNTLQLKMNFTATVAPTTAADSSAGYRIGSRWVDIVAGIEYVCLDASVGAADWVNTTAATGVTSLAGLSDVGAAASTANFVLATPNSITGVYSGRALVSNDIPNLDAAKITSGAFADARIPSLATSKITSGTFADARIAASNVTQHQAALAIATTQLSGTLAHEKGGLEADVSAYNGALYISGGSTSALKHNYTGTAAPTVNADSGAGYAVGSLWFDIVNGKVYGCSSPSAAAAVWIDLSGLPGTSDHGALTGLLDDDHTQYLLTDGTRAGTGIQEFLGINLTDPVEKTISGGAITYTQMFVRVDTDSDSSSDNLDTISGGSAGSILVLYPENDARTVVLRHGVGNIATFDGNDISLDTDDHIVILFNNGTVWKVISNSAGGGGGGGVTSAISYDAEYTKQYDDTVGLSSITTAGLAIGDCRFVHHTHDGATTDEEFNGVSVYRLKSAALTSFTVTSVNTSTEALTLSPGITTTSMRNGQGVIIRSTTSVPGGITQDVVYFARYQSSTTISLHTTRADALSNTSKVDLSSSGSGTITLLFASYPDRVVPVDYAASTNERYWERVMLDNTCCQHVDVVDPQETLNGSQSYFALIFGCYGVVERVTVGCPNTGGSYPTVDVYINGSGGTVVGPRLIDSGTGAGDGSDVNTPAYHTWDAIGDFKSNLRNIVPGATAELHVETSGSGSGADAKGLTFTVWYRPIRGLKTLV